MQHALHLARSNLDVAPAHNLAAVAATRPRFPVNTATSYFKKWTRNGCRPMGMRFLALDPIEADTLAAVRNK